jgi:hypothetical protein
MSRVLGFLLDKMNHSRERGFVSRQVAALPEILDNFLVDDPENTDNACLGQDAFDWQFGCPERIRGLRSMPLWPATEVSFATALERSYPKIKEEFLAARSEDKFPLFQPYRAPKNDILVNVEGSGACTNDARHSAIGMEATSSGAWSVCYLSLHGLDFEDNKSIFPVSTAAIRYSLIFHSSIVNLTNSLQRSSLPRPYHHAFISVCFLSETFLV